MHLRASRTLWLLGALRDPQTHSVMAVHHAQMALHTKKKGKLLSQNRNTHLGPDKAENTISEHLQPSSFAVRHRGRPPCANGECISEHLEPSDIRGPTAPSTKAVRHRRMALHTKKGVKLFSQNRNTFHLESLVWVSDKAENTISGHLQPSSFAVRHPRTEPRVPMALSSIKDSRQDYFLSLFVLPCSDENN